MTDRYESPFTLRYASNFMLKLFSQDKRYSTWRALWVSLAKAEAALGLPVTEEQIAELAAHTDDIDYECVMAREEEVRHDVMAHIYAFGKAAPSAAGIIHLGATSCFVTDNADLIIYRDALRKIRAELSGVLTELYKFAEKYKSTATPGYTHYQVAQPVTVGKRATIWMQDVISDIDEIDFVLKSIKFLGCRGTTGTEASFLELFDGDEEKIDRMNDMIAADFGFDGCFAVCTQTYPRKLDSRIMHALSSVGETFYRMACDIRLLQHDRQIEEPFEDTQIGSSAMPYKRNPMRCERICSLARYLMCGAANADATASSQWLERTLDDSANRRIAIPEGFLCADAVLRLAKNVVSGLTVNEKVIEKALRDYLPFIATENIMMENVKRGGDRQKTHEAIRRCSMAATARMKNGEEPGLIDLLAGEEEIKLSKAEMEAVLDPSLYTGRCEKQVETFLAIAAPYIADSDSEYEKISL